MRRLPLLLALLAGCAGKEAREALPGVSLLEGFSISEAGPEGPRWRLDAEKGSMDEKKGLITFTSPRIRFYDKGAVTSEITSRAGSLRMTEKAATLTDEVAVNSPRDGMRLLTDRLYYSSARGWVWTDEPVTIHRGKTVIKGRGFTANPDLSEIEIKKQETRVGS